MKLLTGKIDGVPAFVVWIGLGGIIAAALGGILSMFSALKDIGLPLGLVGLFVWWMAGETIGVIESRQEKRAEKELIAAQRAAEARDDLGLPPVALVTFFYLLGRDGLPLGEVEVMMRKCKDEPMQYSNKELAAWADRMAKRLL